MSKLKGGISMRKHVKSLICVSLAAALLAGCGSGTGTGTSDTSMAPDTSAASDSSAAGGTDDAAADAGEAAVLKITRPLYFGDVSDHPDLKEEWPKVMEEKFGFPFEINALPRNEYIQKINLTITSGEATGLIGMFGIGDVKMLMEQGAIEPLDEYLQGNAVWNSLPEKMQDMFKIDGKVWAIPAGYQEAMFTRTIRKDWLDNLGLEAPETLDDFYEVSRQFTFNDPDQNGVDDTYGVTASGTWNLQDIFQAFGARLNKDGEGSITYDPNDNAYVDSMLKPEMIEALTYLNKMYEEGILDPELFTNKGSNMREKFWSAKYGSTFYWIGFSEESRPYIEKIEPDAAYVEVPYLEGNISENINHVWFNTIPYVLVKGTQDGDKMVNQFVDVFLGDRDGHLAGAYGIEGKTHRVEDNILYTMIDPETETPYKPPSIVTLIPELSQDLTIAVDGKTEEELAEMGALSEFKHNLIQSGLDSGKAYSLSEASSIPLSPTYSLVEGDIKAAYDTCVSSAITGSAPVEEAVAKYREEVKKLGGQQILDESNEVFGFTGTTTY